MSCQNNYSIRNLLGRNKLYLIDNKRVYFLFFLNYFLSFGY
ncbi:hypothetical protein BMETH_245_2 [methanotrophic bacterial endosymbiont of Bathymodiolus sp.]|nr:hypothetical protein BMETH_245_2 [methanotrophic bacterial endosymbiont of Bathymodiolus sp.]